MFTLTACGPGVQMQFARVSGSGSLPSLQSQCLMEPPLSLRFWGKGSTCQLTAKVISNVHFLMDSCTEGLKFLLTVAQRTSSVPTMWIYPQGSLAVFLIIENQGKEPFHTVHGVLKARILKWFAIPFSSGPHFVRPLHHDLSI